MERNSQQARSSARRRNGREGGQTLLELLIVLSLVGVGLSLPAFSEFLRTGQQHARSTIRQLSALLREYQVTSVVEGRTYQIQIRSSGIGVSRDGAVLREVRSPSTLRIEGAEAQTIFLYPRGTVTPMTVHLRDQTERCTAIISLRARLRWSCEAV
jgi:prepilin-type N-terminal cleavage/methylation domain-containing protein